MNIFRIGILLLAVISASVSAEETKETFFTHVNSKLIKTLQVKVSGKTISTPIIELSGTNRIEISFDVLDPGFYSYAYDLIHCDADWTRSKLSQIEYMNGFQGSSIDDFANNMSTTVQYTNYCMYFPNEDVQPKVSGNYALQVYEESDPDQILFTACFSVCESMIDISATVTGNTDIDMNQLHQQLSFEIDPKTFSITYPQTDLKIWVYQNNRRDNAVTNLTPTSILSNKITYTNNRNLIFTGGNEYRRFECLSTRYNGMHVAGMSFHNPYYHVELMTDRRRNQQTYQYDEDQNGRFFIRCSNCSDPSTEADYYIFHFALEHSEIPGGNVYLSGDLYYNVLDENSRMDYNQETGRYEKVVLLKQGNYNYQYLFVRDGQTKAYTAPIEGDFFQTENEYGIYVYYCPRGARYDRLIGVCTINYK